MCRNLLITKRFVMYVGWACNFRCKFCYYLKELNSGKTADRSTNTIKLILTWAYKNGKRAVDFSGGEPSIRKDLQELISHAKQLGYTTICMITNGYRIADKNLLKEYVDAGLNDILFSLHSHDSNLHDKLVGKDNAHKHLIKAIANAKDLGIDIRINQVVTGVNYRYLQESGKLISKFNPLAFNLIILNQTVENRKNNEILFLYRDLVPYLKDFLDVYVEKIPVINIRNLPFCLLKGYEKHIKTMWQRQYEKVEWDYFIDRQYRMNTVKVWLEAILGMIMMMRNPRLYKTNMSVKIADGMQRFRIWQMRKQIPACSICKLRYVCSGISRLYRHDHGDDEFLPYDVGDIVYDPTQFMLTCEKESI